MLSIVAYIGIGSNLDNPITRVSQALQDLRPLSSDAPLAASRLYRNPPWGPPDQPEYINAVARLQTSLQVRELLTVLQAMEQSYGRMPTRRWGPRILDLDILLYGDLVMNDPHLTIPHPRMHLRPFVLYPLQEIAPPDLEIPGHGRLAILLKECPSWRMEPIEAIL